MTRIVLIFVSLLLFIPAVAANQSLYDELGQKQGIENIVEELLFNIADDRRIRHHFAESDLTRVHKMLSEQICELSGGPCTYSGDDMVTSHTGMGVTRADFNALVEALQMALDTFEIPVGAQNRLLALLAPMHHEIVGL